MLKSAALLVALCLPSCLVPRSDTAAPSPVPAPEVPPVVAEAPARPLSTSNSYAENTTDPADVGAPSPVTPLPSILCIGDASANVAACGMTKPHLVHQVPPVYTREAVEQRVEGDAVLMCTIMLDGSLDDCTIVKSLPLMDEAILTAVRQWRYTPVHFRGKPQMVRYRITVRILPPDPAPPQR